jgi:hypothetical protein
MEFVPGKGDAVRGVVIGGLAMGGEAPGGNDASEEEREEVNGRSLAASELLLTSDGKTCQFSSSDEGVVWASRFSGMGRRWGRGCIDW